jgi:chorismate--pyruvate lyase
VKPDRRTHLPGLAESALLRSLLRERGSLTRRLVALSGGRFAVRVDRSQWAMPTIIEARAIGVRVHELALIREVTLLCDGEPAVYARSVIPRDALRGRYRGLARLGSRPLGELLFTDHRVRRGRTRCFIVRDGDPLFDNARRRAESSRATFWGRATLFYIDREPLLVTEVFLDYYD